MSKKTSHISELLRLAKHHDLKPPQVKMLLDEVPYLYAEEVHSVMAKYQKDPDILTSLYNSHYKNVRVLVAENICCPEYLLIQMVDDKYYEVREAICENPAATDYGVINLLVNQEENIKVIKTLVQRIMPDNLLKKLLVRFHQHKDFDELLTLLADRPNISEEIFSFLLTSENAKVRLDLAHRGDLSDRMIEMLCSDSDVNVVVVLAQKHYPSESRVWHYLFKDKRLEVLSALVKNPNTPYEKVKELGMRVGDLLDMIAERRDLDLEMARWITRGKSKQAIKVLLQNKTFFEKTNEESRMEIFESCYQSSIAIAVNIARNKKASSSILEKIYHHYKEDKRRDSLFEEIAKSNQISMSILSDIYEYAVREKNTDILISLAENKLSQSETMDQLLQKEFPIAVRVSAAKHKATSTSSLRVALKQAKESKSLKLVSAIEENLEYRGFHIV